MRILDGQIRLTATDLSNHLACHHLTTLDLSVARGQRAAPDWSSPDLFVVRELGLRHEAAYLRFLQEKGMSVVDLRAIEDEEQSLLETRSAMERGVGVIAQGSLAVGRWFGRPDVLQKVAKPSRLGKWSYEVYDCKLTRQTRATTILQLALYSSLLAEAQGEQPEFMCVVPAGQAFHPERYRVAEFAAYYRYVRRRLEVLCDDVQREQSYPEPCEHCEVCRWFAECDARRRQDDHLSLVAGITRLQRNQLNAWETETMLKLSALPIPLQQKPLHGSKEAFQRVREQARVQVQGRTQQTPVYELLPLVEGMGFRKLPEPSRHDVFVDLEGDPFVEDGGRQYLFGFVTAGETGRGVYQRRWSFTAGEEKQAFEWIVDEIMRRWNDDPAMHVYHFGAYEPSAFKSLMGRHVTREDEVDRMLRAGLFVDLHTIVKQAVRASVEEYSLKALEAFHSFRRMTPLAEAGEAMRFVEHWLELGSEDELPERVLNAVQAYNEDDCRSAASLT
jgi:predicted RecB family nuclease